MTTDCAVEPVTMSNRIEERLGRFELLTEQQQATINEQQETIDQQQHHSRTDAALVSTPHSCQR